MAAINWPTALPQTPQKGFSEAGGVLILRSPMDAGPAKQRRRGRSPNTMQLSFVWTTAQTKTFENFVENTLRGTKRFNFLHPTRTPSQSVEVRIMPQGSGNLYTINYLGPGYSTVTFQLEILP
jgi:hypothetical protein